MKRYRLVLVRVHERIVSQVELDDLAERVEKRAPDIDVGLTGKRTKPQLPFRAGGAPTPP